MLERLQGGIFKPCNNCGADYRKVTSKKRIKQLCQWAEKGKTWAQSMLAAKYAQGNGVEQSYQRARELFELAASQGDACSLNHLGRMYFQGEGVEKSVERAKEYVVAAAGQGYADAQYYLGMLYIAGDSVQQSNERAREWWVKSAEQGCEPAIANLQKLDKQEKRTTPSFVPKPFECAFCCRPHDPTEHKLRPCKGCHRVFYCGKQCQASGWKLGKSPHKKKSADFFKYK
jgi:hypothetical protein